MATGGWYRMLAIVLAVGVCVGCADGQDAAGLRAEVLVAEAAMNLAIDGRDCVGGLDAMRDSDPLFVSNANVVKTKDALAVMCGQMVAVRTSAVFTIGTRTATILSDVAALVVREGSYAIHFTDGTSQTMDTVITTVWSRDDDGWRMVHLHESYRPPSTP